jgi:LacI family transcriptional regulator
MSDAMAVGAMVRARELSISVPDELEISGFDHVPMISDLLPRFSTVEVPLEAFGEAAISLILDTPENKVDAITLKAQTMVHGERLTL